MVTAGQAAQICGIGDTSLQLALDRDHVKATVVPQGDRTYRMFDADQLLSLLVFRRLILLGLKPSNAKHRIEQMELILSGESQCVEPITFLVFPPMGACKPIRGALPTEHLDGYVIALPSLRRQIAIELDHLLGPEAAG